MTFSVHINMEVEVSLYNLKRRIFFESCQSYSRIFQLIPNVIGGRVKALLHCVITFSSSTFQIQKHACARVCVCTCMHVCVRVCTCVCAQSHWQRLIPSFRGRGFHLAEWPQSFQAETCEITATISHVKQPPQPPTKCAAQARDLL